MEVIKCPSMPMENNSYLCFLKEKRQAILIDPSFQREKLLAILKEENATPVAILLTHGHFDHIAGVPSIQAAYPAIKVFIHSADADCLPDPEKNLSSQMGHAFSISPADVFLQGNETLLLGDMEVKVWHTPGHSPGSVCYQIEDHLFTGDTLMNLSIGRTDFPGGDFSQMEQSLKLLCELQGVDPICPGHGLSSSLAYEKENNPFLTVLKYDCHA